MMSRARVRYCNEIQFTCCGLDCCHGSGERPIEVRYRGKMYRCCCMCGEALREHIAKEEKMRREMAKPRLFDLMSEE